MAEASQHEITQLLRAWGDGRKDAADRLMPLVYTELHRLAKAYMVRERPNHTLQATALVNEAYVRLVDGAQANFADRSHFFAICAQVMRRILVDWARGRRSQKRGGGLQPVELNADQIVSPESEVDLVGLDDALKALEKVDPRKARMVELRFFGGLSVEETAAVLEVSGETVMRDWRLAKSWLRREMAREGTR